MKNREDYSNCNYYLDGEKIDLEDFLRSNYFGADELFDIVNMLPGDKKILGGGASPKRELTFDTEPPLEINLKLGQTPGTFKIMKNEEIIGHIGKLQFQLYFYPMENKRYSLATVQAIVRKMEEKR